jgi:DNA repair photolyase
VTKSYLVIRDAELLAALNAAAGASVYQSIPFADDALARLIEPQAPPPSKRLEAMQRLTQAGVPVGVMVAPIIPGLNDREVPAILERAAAAGASWAGYVALRLAGNVEPVFLARLREALPDRAARVEARIREMRGGRLNDPRFGHRMRGSGRYWDSIEELFQMMRGRLGFRAPQRPGCGETGGPPSKPTCVQAAPKPRHDQFVWEFGV